MSQADPTVQTLDRKKHKNNEQPPGAPVTGLFLSRRVYPYFAVISITLIGFLAYSNTLQSSFHFDDETSIIYNHAIENPWDWRAVWGHSPTRFVTYFTFALNFSTHGLDVIGYHIVNIGLHLGTSLLVCWLVLLTFHTPPFKKTPVARHSQFIALFSGLLFAVHPIQTQAVTYIVQRAALLATLFYVATIALYAKARLTGQTPGTGRSPLWWYAAAVCTAIVGFLTKEIIVTLPFAILVYELIFFRTPGKIRWVFLAGVFVVFAAILAALVTKGLLPLADTQSISRIDYLTTQFKVLLIYLRLLVVAVGQNLDHDVAVSANLLETPAIFGILLIASLLLIAFRLLRNHRLLAFGIFWFFLTMVPESSIFPIRDVMYEHRLYLPMVGFALVLAALPFSFTRWIPTRLAVSFLSVLVVLLGYLTFERNKIWKDEWTLWNDVIRKSPNKARGYNNRGVAFLRTGAVDRAIADFDLALRFDAQHGPAYNNRGNAFLLLRQYDRAIDDYSKALELGLTNPVDLARLYYNRGTAYVNTGESTLALRDLTTALDYDPLYAEALYNRGIVRSSLGHYSGALEDYSRSLDLNPTNAKALNNRGVVHKMLGEYDKAIADFDRAIQLHPAYAEAFFNRGTVRNLRRQFDHAIADFTTALNLNPRDSQVLHARGLSLHNRGDYRRAADDFTQAIELDRGYAEAYWSRALAFASLGRRESATSDAARAEQLGFRPDALMREELMRKVRR